MKTIVRAFVIALAVSGSAAYTQISLHGTATVSQHNSLVPPTCNLNNGCGY